MALKVEFLTNRRESIGRAVGELLERHSSAFFGVAYGTYGAFRELGDDVLPNFLRKGARLRVVFDVDRHFTDPNLIDELCTIPGDVECRLYAPRIRGVEASGVSPAFHLKVYYFERKEGSAAVVGSSNFSPGGLRANHEAAVLLQGASDEEVLADVRRYLDEVWTSPLLIAVDEYERFRDGYAKAYQAAKKRQQPGIAEEAPVLQTQDDVDELRRVLAATQRHSTDPVLGYVMGLVAGGGHDVDRMKREVVLHLRRGLLNPGKPKEGRIFFEGVSERDLVQAECVRRDAERIATRLRTSLRELTPGDTADLERSSQLSYRITLRFSPDSIVWRGLDENLASRRGASPLYLWPKNLSLDSPEVRRAFLQGYMDLRTRISATDALPPPTPFMRVAISVGGQSPKFAARLRELMAAEFKCDPDSINTLEGTSRGRETIIRADARLVPRSYLQSHWQRIVIEDFRKHNERLAHA